MVYKYKKYKIWPRDFGRPTEAGVWRPDFILFILLHHLLYFVYTLFILFILLHHHIELSARSDVKTNSFATLGGHASFP